MILSVGTLDEAIGTYHHTHLMTELIMYNAQAFDSGEYTCAVGPFQETTMVLVAGEGTFKELVALTTNRPLAKFAIF